MRTHAEIAAIAARLDAVQDVGDRSYRTEVEATKLVRDDPAVVATAAAIGPDESARLRLLAAMIRVVSARRSFDETGAVAAVAAVADLDVDPLVDHMRALSSMIAGSDDDIRCARAAAGRAASALPKNPGVKHTEAWTSLEELLLSDTPDQEQVKAALGLANNAVALLSLVPPDEQQLLYRGRFYYTRSQLARLAGDWQLARSDIKQALAKERPPSGAPPPPDYERRVAEYIIERRVIDVDQSTVSVQRRVEKAEQTMLGAVGAVGLVIGLITTTVNIVGGERYSWWQAVVIVVAMGVVLVATLLVGAVLMRRAARARRW